MTVTYYNYTDTGAPQLTGGNTSVRGDLIAVLKACLVDGYGSKTAAGWTLPFEDAVNNIAVFRNSDVGDGTGTYYRVDDNVSYQYARARAYRSMTGHSTGSFPFPTDAQLSGGGMINKRSTETVGGEWHMVACERMMYLVIRVSDSYTYGVNTSAGDVNGGWASYCFGDINSDISGDAYCGFIGLIGRTTYNASPDSSVFRITSIVDSPAVAPSWGRFMDSDYTGFNDAVMPYVLPTFPYSPSALYPATEGKSLPYPNLVSGKILYCTPLVYNEGQGVRGTLPGVVFPCHEIPHPWFTAPPDDGIFLGQNWITFPTGHGTSPGGQVLIRHNCTTADWYS